MQYESLFELFEDVAAKHGDKVAYRYKKSGGWSDVTWSQVADQVAGVAKSLIALDFKKGDTVAILSRTRLEWVVCDFGAVSCGAVTVGVYPSNLPEDCAYILNHCESRLVFVENEEQLAKLLAVRSELTHLRHIVIFDGDTDRSRGVMSWNDFLACGADVVDEHRELRGKEIRGDDLASIVYTSGTTGVPKGAMITHKNLIFVSWSAEQSLYLEPHFCTLMFLPLAHVFARLITHCCLRGAVTMAFAEDITTVAENMREIRPHFIVSVPRIYEKVYDKVLSGAEAAGGAKRKLFHWALEVGMQVSQLQQSKRPIPAGLKLRHAVADKLVLHKVRDALGGRLIWAVSGAAPLNKTIAEFFHACGVTILEGIGMTENTSFSHVNRLDNNKFGTVGQAGPGVECRIAADGEVLTRGDNVMKGYFKDPAATAETIDAEGWLLTGDIGQIDAEGFLKITDRKKDLIITAGGKNVAPQRIERILRTSHYIGQVVAFGDKRKFITALVTLEPDNIRAWAAENGLGEASLEELARHPKVRELLEREIEERNRQLASFETVKRFSILAHDFTVESGEMTPTMKIKRKVVTEKYGKELDALYAE